MSARPPASRSSRATCCSPSKPPPVTPMPDLPAVVTDPSLPARVAVYEVGPRDGLQNESAIVPLDVKAEFVRRLVAAGLPIVEATSFVHPAWVPQLADAEDLVSQLPLD